MSISFDQAGGPEVPEYNQVNVQIKGFDFTVLEHYGKWIHNTAQTMDIDVEDGWVDLLRIFHAYKIDTQLCHHY